MRLTFLHGDNWGLSPCLSLEHTLFISGAPGRHHLRILCSGSPRGQNFFLSVVLGIEVRTPHMLDKSSTTELCSQPLFLSYFETGSSCPSFSGGRDYWPALNVYVSKG